MTPNQCSKCSGTDVVVRLVENRQLINHSGRQRIETEFITSDEYDFYWKHTAAKEHLSKHCRSCQHSWRENIAEAKSAPPSPDAELVALLSQCRGIVAKEVERWTRAASILPVNADIESSLLARIDAKLAAISPQ